MPGRDERGFTLLEILLAIAVMALIAASIIGISGKLLANRSASADDVFWKAAAAARKLALQSDQETRLSYDDKTKSFLLGNGLSSQTLSIPSASNDLAVNFLTTQAGAATVLIGGTVVETQTMSSVTFYPDGTCTPFRLQIRVRDGAHTLSVDPWTCARVLTPVDSAATY